MSRMPRDLHSFPTRRSSDLVKWSCEPARAEDVPAALARAYFTAMQSRARADRKSTRLNSSHMSISYAVFCLKKKKLQTPLGLGSMPEPALCRHGPAYRHGRI